MSYVVSIRRPIQKAEFIRLIASDPTFRITSENEDCAVAEWTTGDENRTFVLSQGSIDVTNVSTATYAKMQELARKLNAEVIGEEEKFIFAPSKVKRGVFAGRSTWIGWPVLVITLIILLIWRW